MFWYSLENTDLLLDLESLKAEKSVKYANEIIVLFIRTINSGCGIG